MNESLIKVEHVSKKFCRSLKLSLWYGVKDIYAELLGTRHEKTDGLRREEFWAIRDVSFEVRRGECVGLIGRNGAGKTTLLRLLNGLINPDKGRIELQGKISGLIALGAGFNPILTGRENIYVNASVLGLTKRQTDRQLEEIIEFSELNEFVDMPVQSYSSGMQVRLGFAVATVLKPDILLLDEVLAVGDAEFRSKSLKKIGEILKDCAVVFVSHDSSQIRRICDSVIWLQQGQSKYSGPTELGMQHYAQHAYQHIDRQVFVNTIEHISEIKHDCTVSPQDNDYGDEVLQIEVSIVFQSNKRFITGLCIGDVITYDEVIAAQFDFSSLIDSISVGNNTIRLKLPTLQLSKGDYTLAITIFDESNKRMLFNLRRFCDIQFVQNIRHGCNYAVSVRRLDN